MKNRLVSQLGLVTAAFLLATAITSWADISDLTKAKVVRIKGSARITTGTGTWEPLKVGDVIMSGAVIQTAADSRVDLVLGDPHAVATPRTTGLAFASAAPGGGSGGPGAAVDQNFVRLMENTVLAVDKLAATDTGAGIVTETELDLRAGRVFGTVKKLSAGSRYEVKIPNGVAGIRGTVYMISADGRVSVLSGTVVIGFRDADGNLVTRTVNTGQRYDPRTDEVTDLTPAEQREMLLGLGDSGTRPRRGHTTFGVDDTIYYISPTEGYNP